MSAIPEVTWNGTVCKFKPVTLKFSAVAAVAVAVFEVVTSFTPALPFSPLNVNE